MRLARIRITNFRGIANGDILFPDHAVLVGDNNTCKSTVLEAIDLVLGPERLSKRPVIDEHDFHAGEYLDGEGKPTVVQIDVTVTGLDDEQTRHFRDHLEWWDDLESRDYAVAQVVELGPQTGVARQGRAHLPPLLTHPMFAHRPQSPRHRPLGQPAQRAGQLDEHTPRHPHPLARTRQRFRPYPVRLRHRRGNPLQRHWRR
jgi:hypothetical protein